MSWRVRAESYCFNWLKSLCGAADQESMDDTTGSKPPNLSPAPAQARTRQLPSGHYGQDWLQAQWPVGQRTPVLSLTSSSSTLR